MNIPETKPQRTAVSLNDIQAKVQKTVYTVLPDTTTTICQLLMENGYTILGTSACVDPTKYNQALGEKYAYEDAINKAWPLEGYLLAEEIFKRGPAIKTYSWHEVATYALQSDHMTGDTQFVVRMRDGRSFKGAINADLEGKGVKAEQVVIDNTNLSDNSEFQDLQREVESLQEKVEELDPAVVDADDSDFQDAVRSVIRNHI